MNKLSRTTNEILAKFGDIINFYHTEGKQVPTNKLISNAQPGMHIEFDFIGHMKDKIGFIIEVTDQKENNREKIEKFAYKCQLLIDKCDKNDKFNNFIESDRIIPEFTRIETNNWRFIYIGTSYELLYKDLRSSVVPDKRLYVLNREHFEYIKFLTKTIGKFAAYELLKALDIEPSVIEDETEFSIPALTLTARCISKYIEEFADLYMFNISVHKLLKMARIVRYSSLESWIPEVGKGYQRILNSTRLNNIANNFISKSKERTAFPNALTVIFTEPHINKITKKPIYQQDREVKDTVMLKLPLKYGLMEIVDGQHRLFAFAKSNLSDKQLEDIKLPVIGIKFSSNNLNKIREWAARTFVEINKEQTRVPKELIQLISYSAMNDISPESLAAKILIDLNIKKDGPLETIFNTRPFMKKNKIGAPTVKIVTVVNELKRLFEEDYIYHIFTEESINKYRKGDAHDILKEACILVEKYFSYIKQVFQEDWKCKSSLIFTSKYMAALCRLLIEDFLSKQYDEKELLLRFYTIKINLLRTKKLMINQPKLNPNDKKIFNKYLKRFGINVNISSIEFNNNKIIVKLHNNKYITLTQSHNINGFKLYEPHEKEFRKKFSFILYNDKLYLSDVIFTKDDSNIPQVGGPNKTDVPYIHKFFKEHMKNNLT